MFKKSLPFLMAVIGVPAFAQEASDSAAVFNLEATTISARLAKRNNSSLRITDIGSEKIRTAATGHSYPELIRNVPGVYSSSESGSFADAKINIRGFKQENISVLLNGIPISGLTSGSMYWNNWMGLADATSSIQLQKGIGNSMVSDNSVGGTINIITTAPSSQAYAEAGFSHTGYGTSSAFISMNSGDLGKGWAFNLLGSHNWGSSYADATPLSTWSYAVSVNKNFRNGHSLNFTALGSPEQHEQRSGRLSLAEVEKYGRSYSKNWGWQTMEDGSRVARNLSKNNYFKPYFTLQHACRPEEGLKLVNTVYAALARGGGFYTESTGPRIASFMTKEGTPQIDWDAAVEFNRSSERDANGLRAANIMSDYLAGHIQWGFKSDLVRDFTPNLQLNAGVHYQFYGTWEKERITDLLGADYWYEDYEKKAICGLSGRNPVKKVGDYVRTDNGRDQHYTTVYALALYKAGATTFTLGLSGSGTLIRRWDDYNYVKDERYSPWARRLGGSVKAGVLHRFSPSSSIYANAAFYSRAPYANVFFSNGNNSLSKDVVNEKNALAELGFRRVGQRWGAEVTGYMAYWMDKNLLSQPYRSLDEDPFKYMVKGLDALHMGIEADVFWNVANILRLDAFASFGNWRWKNDVHATIYDPYTMRPEGEVNVYADGLHVGDAPQTQIGAVAKLSLPRGFGFNAEWNWNDRMWADFDPVSRTSPQDKSDSCRLPSWHMLNAGVSWNGSLFGGSLVLFLNLNNIGDAFYVERSRDGSSHDMSTLSGYWGNGRNVNFGLRFRL